MMENVVPEVTQESPVVRTEKSSARMDAVTFLLLALIFAGIVLRVANLEMSRSFLFDEHHFVENARGYLRGVKDWNDHPPFGKLTIAAAIRLLGDRPLAWRLPSLVAGLGILVLGWQLAKRFFGSERAGLVAAALLGVDGFFITYSKTAVLDGQLTFLSLAAFSLLSGPATLVRFASAGALIGLAASVKISAIALVLPVLYFAAIENRRRLLLVLVAGISALATHYGVWAFGLALHHDFSWETPFTETMRLYEQHAGATKMDNPWTSAWPSWLILSRPLVIHQHAQGEFQFILHSVGNPLLWGTVTLTVFSCIASVLWFGARQVLFRGDESSPYQSTLKGSVPFLIGYIGFLLPWMLSRRDPYIYHYLPAYAFGVIVVAGWVDATLQRLRWAGLFYLAALAIVSGYFAPLWAPLPLRASGVEARLLLEGWRR